MKYGFSAPSHISAKIYYVCSTTGHKASKATQISWWMRRCV